MSTRRFAEGTVVSVDKSRSEIRKLLTAWGAASVSFEDDIESDQAHLRFAWRAAADHPLLRVRLTIHLPPAEDLKALAVNRKTGATSDAKLRKLLDQRGRREHRVLLLKLKADFEAAALGLLTVQEMLLPFLEFGDGRTVGEVVTPRLARLLEGPSSRLALGSGEG